jgi:CRP-like cAMP-binding protein
MQRIETGYSSEKNHGQTSSSPTHTKPRTRCTSFTQQTFSPRNKVRASELSTTGGDGYQKLRTRLLSHGLAEAVVAELIEYHTPLNYLKDSMIFRQGAPAHLIYWVSSGLVDLLCPTADGSQIQASLLGPGDIFGFMQAADGDGRWGQVFQARARTNVQLGLITRDRVSKVLSRLEPPLLVQLLGEITALWSSSTYYCTQFLRHELQRVPGDRAPRSGA